MGRGGDGVPPGIQIVEFVGVAGTRDEYPNQGLHCRLVGLSRAVRTDDFADRVPDGIDQQALFGRRVPEIGTDGDSGGHGNVLDRDGIESSFGEQLESDVLNLRERLGTAPVP